MVYPEKIQEGFRSPKHVGFVADENAFGKSASFVCGSFVSFSLKIDAALGRIENVRFRTNGCGFMIAAADVLSEWLEGKSLVDLHGLDHSEMFDVLSAQLDPYPPGRMHCAEVTIEAVRDAMREYRRHRIEEFQGEKALVCTCFGVTEDAIVSVLADGEVTDVDDVTERCRAGSGCGSCRMLIQEMIDSRYF